MQKCEVCRLVFKSKSGLQGHFLSKQHQNRTKSPELFDTNSPQTPTKRKTCMIELEAVNLEVPVLEAPGKWLPQPRPKPCETQKKVKKKTNNRGSKRRKHWSYGEQAPSTRCFCHPPHLAVIVYGFGILNQVEWFNFMLWHLKSSGSAQFQDWSS